MSDKEQATRLADALENGTYLLSVERGATAALLRRWPDDAERIAALDAALKQARVALESYVEPQYVGGVDNDAALLAKARAALRAIEEVQHD